MTCYICGRRPHAPCTFPDGCPYGDYWASPSAGAWSTYTATCKECSGLGITRLKGGPVACSACHGDGQVDIEIKGYHDIDISL